MKKLLYPLILILLLITACDYLPFSGNEPPTAYIDSISPPSSAAGETVAFVGHGTDADGTVVGYNWRSSLDGDLSKLSTFNSSSLSEGEHTIYLSVQDNKGIWSEEVQGNLTVGAATGSTVEADAAEPEPSLPSESSTPTALPYINYFTAEPAVISPGGSSSISWNVSNAEAVTVDYGVSMVSVPPVGSATANPAATTTYTLTATSGASTVSATVTVSVEGGAPAPSGPAESNLPVINSFTASPQVISAGGSSTLSWNVSNATQLTLTSTITKSLTSMTGSSSVSPASTTTYTLTATNSSGSSMATATITVQAAVEKTVTLSLVNSESGYVTSGGEVAATQLAVGDLDDNKAMRAFLSFDISGLAGVEVIGAELTFFPGVVTGSPWPSLRPMQLCEVHYGARGLMPSDFNLPVTLAATAFDSKPSGPINLTSLVQSGVSAAASRFQLQCRFAHPTNSDGHGDFWWTNASLSVTYRE